MSRIAGNTLDLGIVDGKGVPLKMSPRMRSTHLYICGATGTGKSKMLESLIRQDIQQWHKSKCGALIIDPHGSLYDSLINWIAWNSPFLKDVPIVPIDLRQRDWTIGYNVLRRRAATDPAVLVNNMILAMAYVFGVDGTAQTPLFARRGSNVLWSLYENQMTLLEAEFLIDPVNKRLRSDLTQKLSMRSITQDWLFANSLTPKDFDAQFSSTLNRFTSFLRNEKLRLMFGQNGASLDLGKAIEEGQIIIANVSTQGGRATDEDAALFATLLLTDLWTAAKERGKGIEEGDVKPFYVYIDEFQDFVTPTIAKGLDQARGFGLHLTLANQFLRQILHSGEHGQQVYDSVSGARIPTSRATPWRCCWSASVCIAMKTCSSIVRYCTLDSSSPKIGRRNGTLLSLLPPPRARMWDVPPETALAVFQMRSSCACPSCIAPPRLSVSVAPVNSPWASLQLSLVLSMVRSSST